MKNIISLHVLAVTALFSSSLPAMTCSQFNSLGHEAKSMDQVIDSSATSNQVNEFKKVIADHAAEIAGLDLLSKRKKALNLITEKNMLIRYLRDSLAITRSECFKRPNESMKEVAIEQFDFMLDVLAKKL